MGRQIIVTVGGEAGIADLFDDAAPKTAEAVWQALPLRSTISHANFSGEEIAFGTFGLMWEHENQLYETQPGDLGYFLVGPAICIYYGAVRTISPGNVFGRIITNLPRIQVIARRSWRESGIPVTAERKGV
jgi:hypothetical protein